MRRDIISTGVPSLDRITEGGFIRGNNILVAGQPGAGKTTLGLQFLYHGAANAGERGVYVSFLESKEKIMGNALRFGWNFKKLGSGVKFVNFIPTVREKGVQEIFEVLMETVRDQKAKRIVIDSLSALTAYIDTKPEARTFVALLNNFLEEVGCTSMSLLEMPWGSHEVGTGFEEFMGDGLIVLESSIDNLRVRRSLYIPKMRGVEHSLEVYDFFITKNGIRVAPIPSPSSQTRG